MAFLIFQINGEISRQRQQQQHGVFGHQRSWWAFDAGNAHILRGKQHRIQHVIYPGGGRLHPAQAAFRLQYRWWKPYRRARANDSIGFRYPCRKRCQIMDNLNTHTWTGLMQPLQGGSAETIVFRYPHEDQ